MNAKLAVVIVALLTLLVTSGYYQTAHAQNAQGFDILAMEMEAGDEYAWASLIVNGRKFSHLLPHWLHIRRADGELVNEVDVETVDMAHKLGVAVIPVLDNLDRLGGSSPALSRVLARPEARARAIEGVVAALSDYGLAGVDVRFHDLETEDRQAAALFVRELRAALQPTGRILMLSVFLGEAEPADLGNLAALVPDVDYLHALIYEEHDLEAKPRPIAGKAFLEAALAAVAEAVPAGKLIAGLSMVGYDWPDGGGPSEITFPQAMALAQARGGTVAWEEETGSLHLTYIDNGIQHLAYFEDALTVSNRLRQVAARQFGGVSLFWLGSEDPSLWWALAAKGRLGALRALTQVPATLPPQIVGLGEVWSVVRERPQAGRREFTIDPYTGEITAIRYVVLPSPYVLQRAGVPPDGKQIALTFDDGPSRMWTPKILDLLAQYHVPATFFVIGQQALAHPDLMRRLVAEGHELGNHTFTHTSLQDQPPMRATLELNATRYVIAGTTGHTVRFARSPFVANPDLEDEDLLAPPNDFLRPLLQMHERGYLTVGNNLDTRDWELPGVEAIVEAATNRQLEPPGYIILMHDGGIDRRQTLAALPAIVEFYQSQGFQFTTVSGLLGHDPEFGMPRVSADDGFATQFVMLGFNIARYGTDLLQVLISFSIGMIIVRTVGLVILAIGQYRAKRPAPLTQHAAQPFVSIVVPAYNEEKVIGNTIESLLRSNYQNYEVIVVDDGSKDRTLEVAQRYDGLPRVQVVGQSNGGKSRALNHGIALAKGEIIIAMDADTVFDQDFIPHILGHFEDLNVGAVSGNAKVGNREDLIATWQSVEYITSFNLDRRAYTLLNCVTVVPGAAGAWRKRDILAVGGFSHDTLAEDADLTVKIRRRGRRIMYEDRAIAWTEAPNSVRGFLKQRRRWSYGNLQVLWKNRDVLFRPRYGALGLVALPSLLVYLTLGIVAPIVDVGAIWLVWNQVREQIHVSHEMSLRLETTLQALIWKDGPTPLAYYSTFILVEWVQSLIAFIMDRERPWPLLWVPCQRLILRWLLNYVLLATLVTALKGFRAGWGKIERKGSVLGVRSVPHS